MTSWEPGTLYVFFFGGRPRYLRLTFHGRVPTCPVPHDRVETIPVRLAPAAPAQPTQREPPRPATPHQPEWPDAPAWLADILTKE